MTTVTDKLDWAHAEEAALGIAPNPNDDQTLVDWATAEGGAGPEFGVPNNIANYNPLNVSLTSGPQGYGYDPGTGTYYPGASPTPGNTPPVASFSDWTTGIQATAGRLQEPFASQILADLRAGAPEAQTAQAVGASGWGTGDFAGVQGNPTAPASPGPGGASVTLTSVNANPFDLFGIPQTIGSSAASATWSAVGPFIAKAILVMAGLVIVVLGAAKAANPGQSLRQEAPLAAEAAAA